ncbi:MAG: lipoyl(octanoyl) transferase LipB [Dehalococcoidia bacterium]|nr:lipoyl(octanoyl) transferase LipB [Dehalococcoidia bacterium]
MSRSLRVFRFPQVDYHVAWNWQTETANDVRAGAPDALALLQHSPVFTFGRRVRPDNLLVDAEDLRLRGAEVIESDRGGDVTFHGPGQIVGYPIISLKRRALGPVDYVRGLEETLILTLARFGLTSERVTGRPGVWLGGDKIGAIGVRVQGGVSLHGFALNVETDLAWFQAIVPCGIANAGVTSLARELGFTPGLAAVEDALIDSFATVFDYQPECLYASMPDPATFNESRDLVLTHGY